MKQKIFKLFPVIVLLVLLVVPQWVSAINEEDVQAMLNTMNNDLAIAGENFRVGYVEFHTVSEAGIIVYANDRTHQMPSHWVPFDPRRWGTSEIYWMIDQQDPTTDVPWADAEAAIVRAMNTWNTVPCANIPLIQWPDYDIDWGYAQWYYGFGGIPGWYADITHAGWLPWEFFEIIGGPGGGDSILGATYTYWFINPDGSPTDINGDGKDDTAFAETFYNEGFNWGIDIRFFDIESVALHEMGHALSLDHFGKIFFSPNGKLHFAPRALMNAIYYDIIHELLGTDNASFCSLWASWPNK